MKQLLFLIGALLVISGCGGSGGGSGSSETPDTVAPVVTLIGGSNLSLDVNTTYSELGATAYDAVDGVLAVTISGTVEVGVEGTYTRTYTAQDRAGNSASVIRTIRVINGVVPDTNTTIPDTTAPVVTLIGENTINLEINATYVELGASAYDETDGAIDVVISGAVDTAVEGTYLLTYRAEDSAGNSALVIRMVLVSAPGICVTYPEDVIAGREIYIEHCKVCHAADAKSGMYDIRGALAGDISLAMEDIVDMRELGLAEAVSPAERELVSTFLKAIQEDPDVEYGNQCDTGLSKEDLGSRLFFDANLSLRKSMSCSSCHNPGYGFSDGRFHQVGDPNPVRGALSLGDDNVSLGGRNAPTASYAQYTPTFGQNAADEYLGGQFHDGRAATLKDQAKGPFLDPSEMMMPSAASVVARVMENAQYVTDFKTLYGETVFDDTDVAYDAVADAIAKYEKTAIFAPFDSKYDRSRLDPADPDYYAMNAQEQLGYELFFDTNRTNCVLCHSINAATESPNEVFSNFKYENIGTPRNLEALLARDGHTDKIDLGLGGRADINDSTHYGKVRVPTLRNIAVTDPYMSNGVFKELATVLAFYNHMSGEDNTTLNPETGVAWDVAEVNATVNRDLLRMELLDAEELGALEAFLKLLTDRRYEGLLE